MCHQRGENSECSICVGHDCTASFTLCTSKSDLFGGDLALTPPHLGSSPRLFPWRHAALAPHLPGTLRPGEVLVLVPQHTESHHRRPGEAITERALGTCLLTTDELKHKRCGICLEVRFSSVEFLLSFQFNFFPRALS